MAENTIGYSMPSDSLWRQSEAVMHQWQYAICYGHLEMRRKTAQSAAYHWLAVAWRREMAEIPVADGGGSYRRLAAASRLSGESASAKKLAMCNGEMKWLISATLSSVLMA